MLTRILECRWPTAAKSLLLQELGSQLPAASQTSGGAHQGRPGRCRHAAEYSRCAVCSRGPNGIWTLQHAGKPIPKCKTTFATAKPSYTHQVRAAIGSRAYNSLQALQVITCSREVAKDTFLTLSQVLPAGPCRLAGHRQTPVHLQPERRRPAPALRDTPDPAGRAARQLLCGALSQMQDRVCTRL